MDEMKNLNAYLGMKMQRTSLKLLLFLLFVAGIAASEEILLNFYTTIVSMYCHRNEIVSGKGRHHERKRTPISQSGASTS
jgi:hypothetical protein